jgi:hypothetical protein
MGENDSETFSIWDYVVLVVMLLISASIGVYYRFTGGRQKTTQVSNYLLTPWHYSPDGQKPPFIRFHSLTS